MIDIFYIYSLSFLLSLRGIDNGKSEITIEWCLVLMKWNSIVNKKLSHFPCEMVRYWLGGAFMLLILTKHYFYQYIQFY